MLRLLAFVLPLGLDSFAVAAAIGAVQKTTTQQRLRISLVFVIFEGGMPLIGLALGSALARGIGHVAAPNSSPRDSRGGTRVGHAGRPHRPLCTVSAIGLRRWLMSRGGSSL